MWLLAPLFTSRMLVKVAYHFKLTVYWNVNLWPHREFPINKWLWKTDIRSVYKTCWPYLKVSSFKKSLIPGRPWRRGEICLVGSMLNSVFGCSFAWKKKCPEVLFYTTWWTAAKGLAGCSRNDKKYYWKIGDKKCRKKKAPLNEHRVKRYSRNI